MIFSRSLPLTALCLALFASAAHPQTAIPPPPTAATSALPAHDPIRHLDRFVVSAGHDPKTMFDLAQGTSVLAGEELHRVAQGTLGETLAGTPGVSSTYHGPGASRPVIRGLGGDRVRVLDNGVGALDASGLSPDHNTTLEPLFASRIEVLRGPSTLLYGSSAVGGVVNVIDNAIPDAAAINPASGALELRAGGAARERTAVVSAGGGRPRLATRVNALYRRSGDLRIPGVPRRDFAAPTVQPLGTLPGSSSETFSGSIGAGASWAAGKAGAALHHYDTEYGVPAGDGIAIRMRQTRLALEGETSRPFGIFRGATARLGLAGYTHSELGADNAIRTTFDNDAWEARLELPHAALGNVTGTLGLQAARSDLAARGDEVVTPPARTQSGAVFALEELPLGARATLQLGARLEAQRLTVGEVDPALPPVPGYAARTGQRRKSTGASASLGLVVYPAKDWSLGLAAAFSERLLAAAELFAHGPHGGTAAYEVGSTGLGPERSVGLDVSLRRRAGFVTGSIGGFVHRFRDYIYLQELPAGAIPAAHNPEALTPYQFVAADARFTGAEADLLVHLIETEHRRLHFELSADLVRATQTRTREPLPRIPPARAAARLGFEDGRWHALAEVRRALPQRRFAAGESATPGYTQLNASVSRLFPAPRGTFELFLRGRNFTNAEAREHVSFLKEFAPLPGRGVIAGLRFTY